MCSWLLHEPHFNGTMAQTHLLHVYIRQIESERESDRNAYVQRVHAPSFTSSFDDNSNDDDDKSTQAHSHSSILCVWLMPQHKHNAPNAIILSFVCSLSCQALPVSMKSFYFYHSVAHINTAYREIHQFVRWPSERKKRSFFVYIFVH